MVTDHSVVVPLTGMKRSTNRSVAESTPRNAIRRELGIYVRSDWKLVVSTTRASRSQCPRGSPM